jgi:type VI secretion system protein ImpL
MDKSLLPYLIVVLAVAIVLLAVIAFLIFGARFKPSAKLRKAVANRHLNDSFLSSLTALRSKIPDGDFLYRVPWILAIGEPGSGKTSLLRQLEAESSGKKTDVEWFFLRGGALLDVPGEYLMPPQASIERTAYDDGRWKRLLRLLARHRPHRPVDGIVLTVPVTSLLESGAVADSRRAARAASIRQQLDQLQASLRMVLPIHVLVTKCDQVRGFRDLCGQFDPSTCDQLFGWSSESTLETAFSTDRIDEAFDTLAARLLELQLGMFSRDLRAVVDDLFLFPAGLEGLRAPLKDYLARVFHETSYAEPNFLRGIYFCGDVTLQPHPIHPLDALLEASDETRLGLQPVGHALVPASRLALDRHQAHICFVRQFFELKVFPEAKIAKATRGIRLSRDRGLLAMQTALVGFVLIFSIGTLAGYVRLSAFSANRLKPALDILSSRFPQNVEDQRNFSVAAGYDLVDLLGVIDVHGFRALFLPASWTDPINSAVGQALADAFSKKVLVAFKNELTARVKAQEGTCGPVSPIPQKLPAEIDALAQLRFANDLEYQGLARSLGDMDRLRKAVNTYNDLRLAGRGSFQELDQLFRYLINKSLDDETRFRQNPYFMRAMEAQSAGPVELRNSLDRRKDFEACMAVQTESRINNFFASWFGANNPLPLLTNGVADEVDDLTSATSHTREKLRFLVDDARRLDALVSGGEYGWLQQPGFTAANFPLLSQGVASEPFADPTFLQRMNDNGDRAFAKFKDDLFSVRTGPTGYVLADFQGEIKLDPEVNTVATNIDVLLTQDFMAESTASPLLNPAGGVIWHKAALQRSTQLMDSYDKYLKDNLPLIPTGLRSSIQNIAQEGLRASVLSSIAHAQEPVNPMSAGDPATLMMEIRSFDEALPQLTQIAASIGPSASASSSDLDRILFNQATALSQQLSRVFKSETFFAPGGVPLSAWDGVRPLSLLRFGVNTPEDLDVYLGKQLELLRNFALDFAQPLEQFLQSHQLQDVNGPDIWAGAIKDVKDFDANKPGNSIAAMENFVRTGLDKINLANACLPVVAAPPSADYFLVVRAKLQRAAVERCGDILLDRYNTGIAQFFNQKLAGKFPFGPLPAPGEAAEADAEDTVQFLNAMSEAGAPLLKYLQTGNRHADIYSFLKDADTVRQFFAGGLADDAVMADFKIFFRIDRSAEVKGDEIIEWKLQAGDGSAKLGDPANGLRWTYGAPVIVALRFAKDSPDVPLPATQGTDAWIDGRTVRYEYHDPWSLFRLLSLHSNALSEFGTPAASPSGTLLFVIPTVPDSSLSHVRGTVPASAEARVFARLAFLVQDGKERREISIPTFPQLAPTLHPGAAALSPN